MRAGDNMTRDEIIREARTWIGTRWQRQASLKGVATDCVGLVRGVGRRFGLQVDNEDLRYSHQPHHKDERLYRAVQKYMTEIPLVDMQPGDVLLFGADGWPAYHIGILSYDDYVIHTWMDIGHVVESRLDADWRGKLRFAFVFPGVE